MATQYDERVPENLREWADEMIECFQEERGIQVDRLGEFCHSLVLGAYCDGMKAERVRAVEVLRGRLTAILTGMEFSEEELADVLAVFDD